MRTIPRKYPHPVNVSPHGRRTKCFGNVLRLPKKHYPRSANQNSRGMDFSSVPHQAFQKRTTAMQRLVALLFATVLGSLCTQPPSDNAASELNPGSIDEQTDAGGRQTVESLTINVDVGNFT